MFNREMRDGTFIGYSSTAENAFLFFGSRHLTRDLLAKYFPDYKFAFLKQVHGKHVVEAKDTETPEADAHFTSQKNLALVVQSADCVPILLAAKDKIAAIHSGWRSSALNIVAAVEHAAGLFTVAAIGPHILMPSFEVGLDVSKKLMSGAPAGTAANQLIYPHEDKLKVYFDLSELIRLQLTHAFGDEQLLLECPEDTKLSPHFASFRRDRDLAGRQLSFIVLK